MKKTPRFGPVRIFALLLATSAVGGAAPSLVAQTDAAAETSDAVLAEESSGYESPEAAFAAAQAAFNARDWSAFVECVTPAGRDELVGQFALAFASMAQQPGSDPRVAQLVEAYLPRNFDPTDIMLSDDAQAETIRLAKRIGKPEAFFVAAMSLIFQMQYGQDELAEPETPATPEVVEGEIDPEQPPTPEASAEDENKTQPLDAEVTAMSELNVEGDQAEAKVTITTSTGDQHDRWAFERHEDAWYLSLK